MKQFVLLLASWLVAFQVSAAQKSLWCSTDKSETDPDDEWFRIAHDSNPDIEMDLEEISENGRLVYRALAPQTLVYEFSQSGGGYSPWSLHIERAMVDGDDVQMTVQIRRDTILFLREELSFKLHTHSGQEDSQISIINPKLAVEDGKYIYNGPFSEELSERFLSNYMGKVQRQEFVKYDFVSMLIGTCRLTQ